MSSLRDYLDFAKTLAYDAGEIAKSYASDTLLFETKGDNTPVTLADEAINKMVIEKCQQTYPHMSIVGEEASSDITEDSMIWVCDPIDGTLPYMFGTNASTFCLALVENGMPVVGVVYNFANDRLFSAIKGEGAWLNDQPLQPPTGEPMKFIDFEWWYASPYNLQGLLKALFEDGYQAPNYTSTALMSMMAAVGLTRGVIYAGTAPWDVAAAKVIIEECGGKVTSLDGSDQRYDKPLKGAIIALEKYHGELLEHVAKVL